MIKGERIELSPEEVSMAKMLAIKRYKNARNKGIKDMKMGDQSNWETDLNGMAAEIACAKILNLYPDFQIKEMPKFDLMSGLGNSIDVKSTKYRKGRLVSVLWKKNNPCDVYVLITGEIPVFYYCGYATKEMLFRDENIKNLGHGDGYCMDQHNLL